MVHRLNEWIGIVLVLIVAQGVNADTMTLRVTARVNAPGPVLLGDVAALEGDEALRLAEMVVVDDIALLADGKRWAEVTMSDVRAALERAGASLSRVSMSGGTCTIRLSRPSPVAHPEVSAEREPSPVPEVIGDTDGSTIRAQVAASIARLFGAEQRDVRLLFDRSDEPLMSQTTWGRRVAIQPTTSGSSSSVVVEVRIFSGTDAELLERRRLRVEAEVRREVVVMVDSLRRGQTIGRGDVDVRELWMTVNGSAPVMHLDDAIGTIARRRIDAGDILRTSDLEPPILIKRGEMVTVHCLRSAFAVRSRARAQADGRRGEVIELRLEGSKRSFTARVDGPGEAVMDLDGGARVEGRMR